MFIFAVSVSLSMMNFGISFGLQCPPMPENCTCNATYIIEVKCQYISSFPKDLPSNTGMLALENVAIEEVNSEDIGYLQSLVELTITNATIEKIKFESNMSQLREVFLVKTKMKKVNSLDFAGASELIRLSITNSEIGEVNLTEGMDRLKYLTLNGNNLITLRSKDYSGAPKLTRLDVQKNHINTIQITYGFENLTYLELSWNRLTVFNSEDFSNASNLEILRLKHNDISLVDTSVEFPKLRRLNLMSNKIREINGTLMRLGVPNIKRLDLDNNRIICSCELWPLAFVPTMNGACVDPDNSFRKISSLRKGNYTC